MYRSILPEQLAERGIVPDLFFAAKNYAEVVSGQKPTYPLNMDEVDRFNEALKNFVGVCVQFSDSDPTAGHRDMELRWVDVAKVALKDCGKLIPELKGIDKTRLFGPNCVDEQRRLYEETALEQEAVAA